MTIEDGLVQQFLLNHPANADLVLERHEPAAAAEVLSGMSNEAIAAALMAMTPGFAVAILSPWQPVQIARILVHLDAASCARLLRRMGRKKYAEIVELLPERESRRVEDILQYESNTAGALMDPDPPLVRDDDRVERSMRRIREESSSAMPYIYVVDGQMALCGVLRTSEFISADPEAQIRSLMKPVTEFLSPKAGPREILDHPGWRSLRALPVVDRQRHLLGVIRFGTYVELLTKLQGADAVTGTSTVEALGDLFITGFSGLLEAVTHSGSTAGVSSRTEAPDKADFKREKG